MRAARGWRRTAGDLRVHLGASGANQHLRFKFQVMLATGSAALARVRLIVSRAHAADAASSSRQTPGLELGGSFVELRRRIREPLELHVVRTGHDQTLRVVRVRRV